MDEAAIQRVVNFSSYLKSLADLILDKAGIVSLDTWTLYEIEEAFSLIFEVEKYTSFHVLPPNNRQHPAIPHIQFLYDILQSVKKLKILTKPCQVLPLEQQINLKCFRNLQSLELDSIPVHQLKGLQNLRPLLKSLTVKGVCQELSEILLKCGADRSTEFPWENLQIANFSGNALKQLDNSLRLLSVIKVLDLSYCELLDVSALVCLPVITTLDLSYNKLTGIPSLSDNASNSLICLNISNNMIIDLRGIENFSNLEELNMKENFVSVEQGLIYLGELPHLQCLNLLRNPITCGINYRISILGSLNTAVKFRQEFMLDDSYILLSERNEIGIGIGSVESDVPFELITYLKRKVCKALEPLRKIKEKSPSICSVTEAIPEKPPAKDLRKSSKKKTRRNSTRHVSNEGMEGTYDKGSPGTGSLNEGVCGGYQESTNDRLVRSSEDVASVLRSSTFEQPELHSSFDPAAPSQSEKLLEEILNSDQGRTKNICSMKAAFSTSDHITPGDDLVTDKELSCSISCASRDVSPLYSDDEDSNLNEDIPSVVATLEQDANVEPPRVVFLSFGPKFYIERDVLSGCNKLKLSIQAFRGLEVLQSEPYRVQLEFSSSLSAALRSRIFTLQEEDFKVLKQLAEPFIDQNRKEETMTVSSRCQNCGGSYHLPPSGSPSGKNETDKPYCEQCNFKTSALPSQSKDKLKNTIDSENLQDSRIDDSVSTEKTPAQSERNHRRDGSAALSSDSGESVVVCSSNASSCVRQESDLDFVSSTSMSSIEVLPEHQYTNAEEVSTAVENLMEIEAAIQEPSCSDIRTSYIDTNIDSMKKDADASNPSLMQESSSSGSMTGSVCTAVDRSTSALSTPAKELAGIKLGATETQLSDFAYKPSDDPAHAIDVGKNSMDSGTSSDPHLGSSVKSTDTLCENSSLSLKEAFASLPEYDSERRGIIFQDSPTDVSLTPRSSSLLGCYTGYNIEFDENSEISDVNKSAANWNSVSFSYDCYASVDHRLKLYFEVFLFTEPEETLQGLVKAIILMDRAQRPFNGILVISSRKAYILAIKFSQSDSPQEWLELKVCCFLEEVYAVHALLQKQGIILRFKSQEVLLCLADPQRTEKLVTFLSDSFTSLNMNLPLDDQLSQKQWDLLTNRIKALELSSSSSIELLQIVTFIHDDGLCSDNFLVMTNSHMILLHADLCWFLMSLAEGGAEGKGTQVSTNSSSLTLHSVHPLDDVTHIEVFSDTHLKFEFYPERGKRVRPPWNLYVSSPWVGFHIVQTFRPLWLQILKVECDVVCYSETLFIVKELLKDTPFKAFIR